MCGIFVLYRTGKISELFITGNERTGVITNRIFAHNAKGRLKSVKILSEDKSVLRFSVCFFDCFPDDELPSFSYCIRGGGRDRYNNRNENREALKACDPLERSLFKGIGAVRGMRYMALCRRSGCIRRGLRALTK